MHACGNETAKRNRLRYGNAAQCAAGNKAKLSNPQRGAKVSQHGKTSPNQGAMRQPTVRMRSVARNNVVRRTVPVNRPPHAQTQVRYTVRRRVVATIVVRLNARSPRVQATNMFGNMYRMRVCPYRFTNASPYYKTSPVAETSSLKRRSRWTRQTSVPSEILRLLAGWRGLR